jgi:MFS family permease
VLFLYEQYGSYAVAGAVTGALSLGTAVGQPLVSRLVDARGTRVLVPMSAGHAAGLAGIVVLGHRGTGVAGLVACGLLAGAALPPTSSVLRASWPQLLSRRPELLNAAYALDAVLIQLSFLSGPLIVAASVTVLPPDAPLLLAGATALAGTAAFAALHRVAPVDRPSRAGGLLGALAAPGIRTLVLSQIPIGIAFGSMQVTLPAFAESEGSQELAGVLLATLSLASVAGGLVYGSRPRTLPLDELHVRLARLVPLGFAFPLLAWSVPSMVLLVIPAGGLLSAFFATRNQLAGVAAAPGTETEAVTWPLTALIAGMSIGAALAGVVAEGPGWRAGIAGAVAFAALGR